jgi:rubrerythrin
MLRALGKVQLDDPATRIAERKPEGQKFRNGRSGITMGLLAQPPEDDRSDDLALLIDKLGERLAFERAGARLYEALLSKLDSYGSFEGGPERADLEEIRSEEHEHFLMVREAITDLGGDPARPTPSANLVTLTCRGVQTAIHDPRVDLRQSLEAMLIAELSDSVGWEMLISIAENAGKLPLAESFKKALQSEAEHVDKVQNWIKNGRGVNGSGSSTPRHLPD